MYVRLVAAATSMLFLAGCGGKVAYFESVLELTDTTNDVGPYVVEAFVVAPRAVGRLAIVVSDDPNPDVEFPLALQLEMDRVDGDDKRGKWRGEIPGQPPGTTLYYYLELIDKEFILVRYPHGAPGDRLEFTVSDTDT